LQKKPFVFSLPDNNSFYDTSFPCRLDPEDRKNNNIAHFQNKLSDEIGKNKNHEQFLSAPVYQHEYRSIPGQGSGKIEQTVDSWGVSGKQYSPGQTRELIEDPFFIQPETKILGQIMGVYIVAETDKGLLLIDQHAAHERIVYESLKKKIALSKLTGQGLLVPEVVEFNHKESAILQNMIPDLELLGIVVEPFGGTSFVIKSIPSIISEKDIKFILTDIIEKTLAEKDEFSKDRWLDECIMSMACRQAIKASHRMNITEMQNLVHELEKCENPGQCPHGRPTMIIVSGREMEKWFKRTL
jgi:DNA mismatch repair ATPase MutL